MLLSAIADAVNADLGVTVTVSWLEETLIPRAVRQYSMWNGVEAETTVTTVADQEEYDLPSDCVLVIDAEWWPSGTDVLTGDTVAPAIVDTKTAQGFGYTRPSEHLIDNINRAAVVNQLRGRWRQKNVTTLVLDPEPTAGGLSVTVEYLKAHAQTGMESERTYTTIPDHHLDALVMLVKAEYLDALAGRAAQKDDFKQGATTLTRGHVAGEESRQARRLRKRAQSLMGMSGAVGGAAG